LIKQYSQQYEAILKQQLDLARQRVPPLFAESDAKERECQSAVSLWLGRRQQAVSLAQINEINKERVAAYRSQLLPELKDLQEKIMKELARSFNESLDYDLVQSDRQLSNVCRDFSRLLLDYRSNYRLKASVGVVPSHRQQSLAHQPLPLNRGRRCGTLLEKYLPSVYAPETKGLHPKLAAFLK